MTRITIVRRLTKLLGEEPTINERPGYRNTYNWGTVWGTRPVQLAAITALLGPAATTNIITQQNGRPNADQATPQHSWGEPEPTGTQWCLHWSDHEICIY